MYCAACRNKIEALQEYLTIHSGCADHNYLKDEYKLQAILDDELQEAQYIGEDGGMVVDGRLTQGEAS